MAILGTGMVPRESGISIDTYHRPILPGALLRNKAVALARHLSFIRLAVKMRRGIEVRHISARYRVLSFAEVHRYRSTNGRS